MVARCDDWATYWCVTNHVELVGSHLTTRLDLRDIISAKVLLTNVLKQRRDAHVRRDSRPQFISEGQTFGKLFGGAGAGWAFAPARAIGKEYNINVVYPHAEARDHQLQNTVPWHESIAAIDKNLAPFYLRSYLRSKPG